MGSEVREYMAGQHEMDSRLKDALFAPDGTPYPIVGETDTHFLVARGIDAFAPEPVVIYVLKEMPKAVNPNSG